ncbi:hypothetical protein METBISCDRAFT_17186 [Metschnikowia bicuspidata]|uniref:Thioesterase domain-containing protein n=1 Tax=Metschnikowia bicuspidata TaxID=27322 RepID=A0A4P9ZB87_9ASCO|nr:hypothetical protein METBISCDRAFT_17186 [Metschnikowia bicuspidata]
MIRLTRRLQRLPIRSVRLSSSAALIKPQFGIVPRKLRFFNWKSTSVFFAAGAALAYSEFIFERYAEYTEVRADPKETVKLDFQLRSHPLYQKLVHPVTGKDWVKLSSWENLDRNILDGAEQNLLVKTQKEYQAPQLTNHTLAVPGAIAVKPVIFHNKVTDETITFVHMGYRLCGHPFIIHGGMIATLLNETFKRNASLSGTTLSSLKTDYMVENISISYRAPSLANQFFVVKTKQVAALEPKLYKLTSAIESEKGKVLVQAEASLRDTGRGSKSAALNASTWKDKLSPLFGSST